MKISCLFNVHWPVAAYGPWRPGFELSRCVDCGHPMMKAEGVRWQPLPRPLVRRTLPAPARESTRIGA